MRGCGWLRAFIRRVCCVSDWGNLIDVVGFCFHDLASCYCPTEDLKQWLAEGSPPVFIGFGSLVRQRGSGVAAWVESGRVFRVDCYCCQSHSL